MDKKERFYNFTPRLTFMAATPAVAKTSESNAAPSNSLGRIRGYAIVWNQLSTNRYAADGSTYKVRLVPGSAKFTNPCVALYEHNQLLGSTVSGTLEIQPADDFGIPVVIDVPNDYIGQSLKVHMERGELNGMSFSMDNGFETKQVVEEDGQTIVNALSYTVGEVTVCYDPAFTATSIEPAGEYKDEKDKEQDDDEDDFDDDSGEMSKATKEMREHLSKVNKNRLYLLSLSVGRVSSKGENK